MRKLILLCLLGAAFGQTRHTVPNLDADNTFTGKNQFTKGAVLGPVTFASLGSLGAPQSGTVAIISDGAPGLVCAGGGTGIIAVYLNGAWNCSVSSGSAASFASPPPLGNTTPNTVAGTVVNIAGSGLFFSAQPTCLFGESDNTLDEFEDVGGIPMWLPQGALGPCSQFLTYTPLPVGVNPTDKQVPAWNAATGAFTIQTQAGGLPDPGSNGVIKRTALNTTAVSTSADIIGLFSGCSGTQYLGADGACHAAAGSFSSITGGTNTAAAMLVGSGASLGPTGTGTITATSTSGPVINVTDPTYGASPSNTAAQNNTAFTAAAAAANAITLGAGGNGQATVYIPYGVYSYSGGLAFTQNVTVKCEPGTTLSYTGSAHAADFGPVGAVAWDEKKSLYVIDGCTWTGGASMTEGLFFTAYAAFPRIVGNKFYNFHGTTPGTSIFAVWFQAENYNIIIERCFYDLDDGVAGNFVNVNNANANGNSLLNFHDNYVLSFANGSQTPFAGGIGVIANGSESEIDRNTFGDFSPNVRLGNQCNACYVHNNYMETDAANASIEIGNASSASGPSKVTIRKIYLSAQNLAWLVGPSPSNTAGFQGLTVDDITLVSYPAATPLVKLAAAGANNQISNVILGSVPAITSGINETFAVRQPPGTTDVIAGTDVWQMQGIASASTSTMGFNHNSGQPFAYLYNSSSGIQTMIGGQTTVAGQGGTVSNHPYNIISNNVARETFDTSGNALLDGPNGSNAQRSYFGCETSNATTTLSTVATTTDTGLNCLPINAVIDSVVYRITTTITTAASFTIGDATTAARFCATQSTLTAGTTGICFVQADQTGAAGPRQTAAAKVRVTANVNPGAGAIRLIVYYHTWTAPTS